MNYLIETSIYTKEDIKNKLVTRIYQYCNNQSPYWEKEYWNSDIPTLRKNQFGTIIASFKIKYK